MGKLAEAIILKKLKEIEEELPSSRMSHLDSDKHTRRNLVAFITNGYNQKEASFARLIKSL